MFRIYNSRTQQLDQITPLDGQTIRIYTCGPTVYNFAHVGNLRAYIATDLLKRYLLYRGYRVRHTMNITDIDDKMIKNSQQEFPHQPPQTALLALAQKYEQLFWHDFRELNLIEPTTITHATDYIPQMQLLIKNIVQAGFGYFQNGSCWFNVRKYSQTHHYGQLTHLDLTQLQLGRRVEADDYDKANLQDFVLWKARKDGEPFWNFEFDDQNYPGRPGWHIECSAMAKETLGLPFDIHTGGIDLKFPHHENEIAQNVAGYGVENPVNIWFHNEFLQIEGQKMAKSLGNLLTLPDLIGQGHSTRAVRQLLLSAHYRTPFNLTQASLAASQQALDRLDEVIFRSKSTGVSDLPERQALRQRVLTQASDMVIAALDNDLNISQALGAIFEAIKTINAENLYHLSVIDWLKKLDNILVLQLPTYEGNQRSDTALDQLLAQRQCARQASDFALADQLRNQIKKQFNVELRDTPQGQQIKPNT